MLDFATDLDMPVWMDYLYQSVVNSWTLTVLVKT